MSRDELVQVSRGKVRAAGDITVSAGRVNIGERNLARLVLEAAGLGDSTAPFHAFGRARVLVELQELPPPEDAA